MKKLIIVLVLFLIFLSSCKINKNQDNETFINGKCEDGFKYLKTSCTDNKCSDVVYKQDPCFGHYLIKECDSDLDCSIAGCSGQICTTKDKAIDTITTCEFRSSYECLKLTSCLCINGECKFDGNDNYFTCLEKYK